MMTGEKELNNKEGGGGKRGKNAGQSINREGG